MPQGQRRIPLKCLLACLSPSLSPSPSLRRHPTSVSRSCHSNETSNTSNLTPTLGSALEGRDRLLLKAFPPANKTAGNSRSTGMSRKLTRGIPLHASSGGGVKHAEDARGSGGKLKRFISYCDRSWLVYLLLSAQNRVKLPALAPAHSWALIQYHSLLRSNSCTAIK